MMKITGIEDQIFVRITEDGKLRTLAEITKDIIEYAIEDCDGNKSKVAKLLDLGRSTIYRKIAQ